MSARNIVAAHGLVIARQAAELNHVSALLNSQRLPKSFDFGGVRFKSHRNMVALCYLPSGGKVAVIIEPKRGELAFGLAVADDGDLDELGEINVMFFDSGRDGIYSDESKADKHLMLAIKCAQELAKDSVIANYSVAYLRSSWSTFEHPSFKQFMDTVRSKNAGYEQVQLKQDRQAEVNVQPVGVHGRGYYVPPQNAEEFKRELAGFLKKANVMYAKLLKKHDARKATF